MHRPRTRRLEHGKSTVDHRRQFVGSLQGVAKRGNVSHQGSLIGELVEHTEAHAEFVALVDGGDHQHRHRVSVRLPHRGGDVGHARPGDDETRGGPSTGTRETVGHEPRTLLVTGRDVSNAGAGKAAVELDGVHAGNAEHMIDAVVDE